jgi:methionyl aminopeptidase
MITIKSRREIEIMRRSGKITSSVLSMLLRTAKAGMTTGELDRLADEGIRAQGGIPTFKGYHGYKAAICASVNDEVVHGIPGDRVLKDGDLLSIDIGTTFEGFVSDSAATVAIGNVSEAAKRLMRVTQESLMLGIAEMQKGNSVADIARAVQRHAEANGYGVVRELVGHGVGRQMHEEPQVPNYVTEAAKRIALRPGMTLALEPMITQGSPEVATLDDGWTVVTADGKLAAHFEHPVALTEEGPRILTLRDIMEHQDVARFTPAEEVAA